MKDEGSGCRRLKPNFLQWCSVPFLSESPYLFFWGENCQGLTLYRKRTSHWLAHWNHDRNRGLAVFILLGANIKICRRKSADEMKKRQAELERLASDVGERVSTVAS